MILKLGDKEVDLSAAFPMTIGDWKAFERMGLVDKSGNVDVTGAAGVSKMIRHFCCKVDGKVTEKMVDAISLKNLKPISEFLTKKMGEEGGDDTDPN